MNIQQRVVSTLTGKSISANPETDLWPDASLANGNPISMPTLGYSLFTDTPYWHSLKGLDTLFEWYQRNPVFYAIVNIKARAYANMKIQVVNRKTGKVEPENTLKDIPKKLYRLFKNPNAIQSQWEFWMQRKIFEEVAGNSFTYGDFTIGFEPSIANISDGGLWNVWPAGMNYKLTGKYFGAKKKSDIITGWEFKAGNYKQTWKPEEILHLNKPNTRYQDGYIFGQSPAVSLYRALTNIDMAYEARNVIMLNRGMRGIISSAKGDATGKVALTPDEKDKVFEAFGIRVSRTSRGKTKNTVKGEYGFLNGQRAWMISDQAINVTMVDQDVNKLGLFDEIATDGIMCCNGFGVPEILLKLYLKGNTFENQRESERRLYQGTIIPEAENDINGLNSFLALDDEDWYLQPCYDHVACLQESEKQKAEGNKVVVDTLLNELKAGSITMDEYRLATGRDPLPKPKSADGSESANKDTDVRTQEQQAALRGSVGGVTGILSIQSGVSMGTTTYDAGIAILTIVYGFSDEDAKKLLGAPKEQTNESTTTAE